MAKLNIKKGDNVVVISGKDKGKTGKILQVASNQNRAVVDGINIVTKHQKPKNQKDKGGLIKKPAPIDMSNIMVVCPACGKATRISRKEIEGKNVRICKKCGASLDKAFVKAVKKDIKKKEEAKEEAKVEKLEKVETKVVDTEAKKPTTKKVAVKKPATEKVAVKKVEAKVSSATTRRSTNRGK